MLTFALLALLLAVIVAAAATLVDCWIRGRFIFAALREERALLDAGYVPVTPNANPRMRKSVRYDALATPARASSRRLSTDRPLPQQTAPGAA